MTTAQPITGRPLPSHAVRERRFFYDTGSRCAIIYTGTLAECREFIRTQQAADYYLFHNQSGRPALRTVRTAGLSPWAIVQACAVTLERTATR